MAARCLRWIAGGLASATVRPILPSKVRLPSPASSVEAIPLIELSPTRYRIALSCSLVLHVLCLVYCACVVDATTTNVVVRAAESSPASPRTLILLAHLFVAVLHGIQAHRLVTRAFFQQSDFVSIKPTHAPSPRMYLWLTLHRLLGLLSHSIQLILLLRFLQSRAILVLYAFCLWSFSLVHPCFLTHKATHVISLAFSLLLDVVGGIFVRMYLWSTQDTILLDISTFTVGFASVFPNALILSALSAGLSCIAPLKPVRSPQKVRRVNGASSIPSFESPGHQTSVKKQPLSMHITAWLGLGYAILSAVGVFYYLFALPPTLPGCSVFHRRLTSSPVYACAALDIDCSVQSLELLSALPSAFLFTLGFANCPNLSLSILDAFQSLRRVHFVNTSFASSLLATFLPPSVNSAEFHHTALLSLMHPQLFPSTLSKLSISYSDLEFLPFMPQLHSLTITRTPLQAINLSFFPQLEHLSLADNHLEALYLAHAPARLQSIDLSGNPIAELPDNLFLLPHLETLVLERTLVDHVGGGRVSSSLVRIWAAETALCRRILAFLSKAQVVYSHGDTALVECVNRRFKLTK
ncbi:hypothetical protein Ae201684P_006603 [Aphanomyces euteiches]|uniref:Uncharacterized protein n=1 Tax=Aphanomyces euteiches TaxID=100861 RepID=A0A6G0XBX9_9STRA|nr:hypothetical protein Ae201684_006332 [Aphanomyces euteiches]KAH9091203.1 hypothetical protein Ae201684P_006603 [Aphanomyces euteiches]